MKKLLLLSFVLFSFSSFAQTIENKEIYYKAGHRVTLNANSGRYGIASRNAKYNYINDTKVHLFTNKLELIVFLDSLDKFTNLSNYSPSYEKASLSAKINGETKSFVITKKATIITNPERKKLFDEMIEVHASLPPKKASQYMQEMNAKINLLPRTIDSEPYLEIGIFVEDGWITFTNETIKEIKLALK